MQDFVRNGTVLFKEGALQFSENGIMGEFTVDMNTIVVSPETEMSEARALQNHLRGPAFFDVATYPTATFAISESNMTSAFTYVVTGDMTFRGITQPVTFEAEIFSTEHGDTVTAVARFALDRTVWGVVTGSSSVFEMAGEHIIADEIRFDILLVADAVPA